MVGEPEDGETVDGEPDDGDTDEVPDVLTANSELLVEPIEPVGVPGVDEAAAAEDAGADGVDDVVGSSPLHAKSRHDVASSDPKRRRADRWWHCWRRADLADRVGRLASLNQ